MNLQQQARVSVDRAIAKGATIIAIAEQSDVSTKTVSRIRNGHKVSDLSVLSVLNGVGVIESAETLHDKVEAIAAGRVNNDKGAWDVDLNCAKYRRVMQLEKELEEAHAEIRHVQHTLGERGTQITELSLQLQKRDAELEQAQEDIHDMKTLEAESAQFLRDANAEIKRLTALADTHGQSWKAACVQVEQLQKQLNHGQAQFASLHESYNQQVDDEAEMLAQIDTLFAERDNMRTEYEYSLMRLRVRCFALVCAIVFLIVSGLVVWGAV